MNLGNIKKLIPVSDAYELKPGHTYILCVSPSTPLLQMEEPLKRMNALLADEGIKVVVVADDIPILEGMEN